MYKDYGGPIKDLSLSSILELISKIDSLMYDND